MKDSGSFKWSDRLKSFRFAYNGLKFLLRSEHNARVHLALTILIFFTGILTGFSASEWIAVILVIALVFITELLNTAIEKISDIISPEYNEMIKWIKDLAAAAVLIAAISAVLVAGLILIPRVIFLIGRV
jgi:diacylglycerol kinase (ATP)